MLQSWLCTLVGFIGILTTPALGQDVAPRPGGIEARADDLLRRMSSFLATARHFSFEAHDMVDELLDTGQKLQFSSTRRVVVRRPNRVLAEISGDTIEERVCYDGRTLTILDRRENVYGAIEVPDNIDETLDYVAGDFGVTMPLSDLLFSNPYEAVIGQVRFGHYVGLHTVDGARCHHLAFRQDTVDWQIWIEDGDRPLPRKLVITYKTSPGQPQYVAVLGKWNLSPDLTDTTFVPAIPDAAQKIDLKPIAAEPGTGRRPTAETQ